MKAKNDNTPKWHIVRSRPSLEVRAGEELLGIGQTVYVPQYRKEYRHNRNKAWVTKYYPLMRGYLFVMASPHWGRTLSCPSVLRVLRNLDHDEDGTPIPIDDFIIRELRARQEAGDFDEMRLHGRVDAGTELRISDGPLSGLKGMTTGSGDRNVVMHIHMFGQSIRAKVPLENLRPVG